MKITFKCLFAIILVSTLWACKKGDTVEITLTTLEGKLNYTPETGPPHGGLGSPVVLNASGNYVTSYGGGINFGSTFTYPLSITNSQNGTPYAPYYFGGYSDANMLEFIQNGPHFVMLLGTVVGGMPVNQLSPLTLTGIENYKTELNKWFSGERETMPHLASAIGYAGGSSDGILTVSGTFVLDTQSPTNVSVTNLKYQFTVPDVE